MNYIAEIKAFYDWIQTNPISADAQALWHTLMYIDNKCAVCIDGSWLWRAEFTVSNQTLLSYLEFSRTQLDRMRNVLIQKGRIRYRKGKGNQCGAYQIIPFDTQYVVQTVTQSGIQTGMQLWHKQVPLNNNTSTSNFNFLSGDGGAAPTPAPMSEAAAAVGECFLNRDIDKSLYFGMTGAVWAEAAQITEELFSKFGWGRPGTVDISKVFDYTFHREGVGDETEITFLKERAGLLTYVFEQAAMAGRPRNWNYIDGVMRKLAWRGIDTVEKAEDYDYEREARA